ncbi:hypothetical protein BpHYR1_049035 [Brachionus plicatilis]|uniref:Uncharacterized protein n=1 Tax=Brachionus plicatilis TaxID=10195 RepID=A0A3M7S5W4_BRAPC|nr:hypothetical protein BpHYR1_049035 [Brachionus plicatilis]
MAKKFPSLDTILFFLTPGLYRVGICWTGGGSLSPTTSSASLMILISVFWPTRSSMSEGLIT